MFWLSYECFFILCDAFWLKSAISSHNSCVNRVPTSIYTSFVDFEKNMPDSCAAFGCTNRRSTTSLKFYCIP